MYYLGEGDIEKDIIVEEINKNNKIIYGSKSDYEYNLLIKESLNIMNERMTWRSLYSRTAFPKSIHRKNGGSFAACSGQHLPALFAIMRPSLSGRFRSAPPCPR
ncbi:MAG: hypothetical protein QW050_03110, partial [Candidatus Nitrosocaldaceae archaeon]